MNLKKTVMNLPMRCALVIEYRGKGSHIEIIINEIKKRCCYRSYLL